MRAMRRFAVSVIFSHGLIGSAAREFAARGFAARGFAARGFAARGFAARGFATRGFATRGFAARGAAIPRTVIRRAAVLGLIALTAGTSAVLSSLAAGTGPALATAGSAPRSTLASVIPSTAIPGSQVTFAVYCASARATSATLLGRTIGLTEHIKMRPNPADGDFTVSVILPGSIQPGNYHPSIQCSDGTSTTARLLVPPLGAAGGRSDGAGIWLAAGVLMGLGAVASGIALRRRKRGHSGDPDRSGPPGGRPDDADHHSGQSSLRF
jgi:hypothetical protein